MTTIPPEVLSRVVDGHNLAPAPLGDHLAGGPVLLVFLRHFG